MSVTRLGIDLGSSQIKASKMTPGGKTTSIETIPTPINTDDKFVTHPPDLMLERVRQIPERFNLTETWQAAIASQRSTFIFWNPDNGETLTPLISWRDRRGNSWVENLSERSSQRVLEITGLRPEAGYPLAKIKWLFNEQPELNNKAKNGELCFGSLDTWLLWIATSGNLFRMVPTQASRTLLYDPVNNNWSRELLNEFDIPAPMLPNLTDNLPDRVDGSNLWENSEIVSMVGDQPAASIGGQPPPFSQTRVTLGTAGFVSEPCEPDNCPEQLTVGFTPTSNDRVFQAEGVVLSAGKAIDWLVRVLGINHTTFEQWLNPSWSDSIPLWSPSLNGIGAPFWENRKATLDFLDESTSTREICLGLMVSILQRVKDILTRLPGEDNRRILLDGGVSTFDQVPVIASTLWDVPTAKTLTPHLTCRGALIVSHWKNSFFTGNPWEPLNVEVAVPDSNLPVKSWNQRWKKALEKWRLDYS